MDKDLAHKLKASMRDLDELRVLQYAVEMVIAGHSSFEIFEILLDGIQEVDALYESGWYFIADLIMAGHIMKSVMTKVLVFHGYEEYSSFGRILIATVKDDIHELGKNVITQVLQHNGFEVQDLGADLPAENIVDGVKYYTPDILILSGTMSSSPRRMAECLAALRHAGLRASVRVVVGGPSVTPQSARDMGADAYSGSIKDCLKACHEFMAQKAGES